MPGEIDEVGHQPILIDDLGTPEFAAQLGCWLVVRVQFAVERGSNFAQLF